VHAGAVCVSVSLPWCLCMSVFHSWVCDEFRASSVLQSLTSLARLLCSARLKAALLSGWSVLIRLQFNFPGCSTAL